LVIDGFPGPKGRVGHPDLTQNIGQNLKDLSPAVAHGCRRDFIDAWTSLDTALSGGLRITRTGFQTMRRER
jgi:hypothetical protein